MTTNTYRRLTAGPPEDNLPAIVDAVYADTMLAFGRAEHHAAPLDTRTALAILVRQALEELTSYWPEPTPRDTEFDTALFDLRCQLLPRIRGNATQAEVLREAAQRIEQHATELAEAREMADARLREIRVLAEDLSATRQELAPAAASHPHRPLRAAWGQNDLVRLEEWLAGTTPDGPDLIEMTNPINFTLADAIIDYAEKLRAEVIRLREAPHYDWSGTSSTPVINLPIAPDGGLLVSSSPAAAAITIASPTAADEDDEPVGVTVAGNEPDEEVAAAHENFPVFNWEWDSRIWGRAPQDVRATLRELQEGTLRFRQVAEARRLLIARHVIASLPTQTRKQSDYHAAKPTWMPTATSLVSTFGLGWTELVALGSPWA